MREPSEQGKLPEPDEVEMQEFITQSRLLLGTLGYNLFEPIQHTFLEQPELVSNPQDELEFIYSGDNFSATCIVDINANQFIVIKDSIARKQEAPSLQSSYRNIRAQLIDFGVLVEAGDSYHFTQDYSFTSISAAAQVVSGQTKRGATAWKTKCSNKTYEQWLKEQILQVNDNLKN